ncbi:hypothetical protein HY947_01785 [Candidatus Gottesmanbacteria bacterium]|nr:hypothetical protein [Candidatus Gottesmanbacteria bacterium]
MIDYWIIGISFYGFLVFLILVSLALRMTPQSQRSGWIVRMVFTTFFIQCIALWVFSTVSSTVAQSIVVIIVLSLIFTKFLMVLFIVCVYSPIEASVTLRLLREIGNGQSTLERIKKRYNREAIVRMRLVRLAASGDVEMRGGQMVSIKPVPSLFRIREMLLGVLFWVFGE